LAIGSLALALSLVTALLLFGLVRNPFLVQSALIGKAAPDVELPLLDGSGDLKLSELRGQVVVVNFWASWCRECVIEHPSLQAAWQRYRDQGVVLLGVTFRDRASLSRAFAERYGGDWPLLEDSSSRTALAFGVYGVPETFFIGRDGVVEGKVTGPVTYEELITRIDHLLREPAS
jgi:cytochrome c biogenesis protein CcmG, thiol:disulfide interchange protein DsbE